ncbi:amidohydrolase [Kribbella antibiotica]|uniref:Amidohydrolase n=1 Tax=Kribbella antibiotica TaxID=190195 RepID=A0A4R4ZK97_9ACTN|nr:amidohydrolase family protein [Kribbella antibiotica]TDD59188.1 amidohydrolase [Kribbella antibiotica]
MARYEGPIIDVHAHLELEAGAGMSGLMPHRAEDYWAAAAGLDVRAAAALVMAPLGRPDEVRLRNNQVLALSAKDRRWLPLCSVHPFDGDFALEEIGRVAAAGAAGFKLHPNTQSFDLGDDRVTAIVQEIGRQGLPVLFDGYSPFDPHQPGKFVQLSMSAPDTRIIIAHALGPRFGELVVYDVLASFPGLWNRNVWVDLSYMGALYADSPHRDHYAWSLRKLGVDRILLGSDYPLGTLDSAFAALETLGFSAAEQRQIAHTNAATLFNLTH